ncbi:MAG: beta-galactosidase GalB [Pseudomonadales bacterium]
MRTKGTEISKTSFTFIFLTSLFLYACTPPLDAGSNNTQELVRERLLLDGGWRFYKYADASEADNLIYDIRPEVNEYIDGRPADAEPTAAVEINAGTATEVLKPWILPTANPFIADPNSHFRRPDGNPGGIFDFVQPDFDDSAWQQVNIPHDWAINGPFYEGENVPVGGSMGRLPVQGVGWYRNKIQLTEEDAGKRIYLEIEGAMSYAMVWFNGQLVGGWPFGYASWQLDLTPFANFGGPNQLAIRIDNPPDSSRWYPGAGLYRNVWLTKTQPIHVAQWGTTITTPEVSAQRAKIDVEIAIENHSANAETVDVATKFYTLNSDDSLGELATTLPEEKLHIEGYGANSINTSVDIENPRLWGPGPDQTPNRYMAITTVKRGQELLDQFETPFGIRSLTFDAGKGLFVNGQKIELKGANQHHDLGALGAAFNVRAAQRQLEILQEMGVNAIRMAHNPPAPELLTLTDKMGFLVINEIYDVWERKKTPLDFHLIFPDWSEADLRAFIRRDKNHPSVIMWSVGNEVGEQYTGEEGAAVGKRLHQIAKSEDPTRPTTAAMNYAKPHMPFAGVMDIISLNYQGEGIRNAPAYSHLQGITTEPLYPAFHEAFPNKMIISSENAAALSSRGEYLFPVTSGISAPAEDGSGGNPETAHVSAYELYTAQFGSSADKVLGSLARHPYVSGGFIWSGWDYLGEPTPYYSSRSSYFGVIDLAGFKKDRFYIYQAHWRSDLPSAHILPHWTWPGRVGQVTPVHVITSGDEAELFLNDQSLGKKRRGQFDYRLRWDEVEYSPGELSVVAYKDGEVWATNAVHTAGRPAAIVLKADRQTIRNDGKDLAFITAKVVDANGRLAPTASNSLTFSVSGPGEVIATDNGDPTSLVPFTSTTRNAFNGKGLAIVRPYKSAESPITIRVVSEGLESNPIEINAYE